MAKGSKNRPARGRSEPQSVYVKSSIYTPHKRAARGTYTKAALNAVVQQNANRTKLLNRAAKPIHDALKACCDDFKGNQLWQEMLGRLRRSHSNKLPELLQQLEGLEINKNYPLERLVALPKVSVANSRTELTVGLTAVSHLLTGKRQADCYYYEVLVIFTGKRSSFYTIETTATEWIDIHDPLPEFEIAFKKPAGAGCYVLCVSLQAGKDEKPIEAFASQGMRMMGSGLVGKG